jgi:hypothetical protein
MTPLEARDLSSHKCGKGAVGGQQCSYLVQTFIFSDGKLSLFWNKDGNNKAL